MRAPHGPHPGSTREHESEQYGVHALHEQSDANDTRFVARPGKAEGRTEVERPPCPSGPPGHASGEDGTQAAPPPPRPPRRRNAPDARARP